MFYVFQDLMNFIISNLWNFISI